jgi:hypothetical protein
VRFTPPAPGSEQRPARLDQGRDRDRGRRASWPLPCGVLGYYPNLGVAAGLGEAGKALGALVALGTNVVMIVAGRRRQAASRSSGPSLTS